MDGTYARYLHALGRADVAAAANALDDALGQGVTGRELIRDVVARGQREAGERWVDGVWSVADEHAATAVAEQSMAVVAPPPRVRRTRRRVLLACAEGEWHTFAARLAAELARSSGVDVTLLGGSIPAAHLQEQLRRWRPDALALSVTLPSNLIGASRSILAAHQEGIPVVVGGAAWGDDLRALHRASRLGADSHLHDPAELAGVVDDLVGGWSLRRGVPVPVEALLLDSPSAELLHIASERRAASEDRAALRTGSWAADVDMHPAGPDLQLARYTAASLACDDATILRDLLTWMTRLVTRRGLPARPVHDGCLFLADAVEAQAPSGARLLRAEAELARQRHEGAGTCAGPAATG